MKLLKKINGKHTGLFAAGLLLGTAGVKILSSKDAKNIQNVPLLFSVQKNLL